MLYFQSFPKIFYSLNGGPPIVVTNITKRVRVRDVVKNNGFVYYTYQVQDTDTPEIIAHKYYGDPNRYWIILLTNDIIDPYYDWVLPYPVFQKYIVKKYGTIAAAQVAIDHYEKIITKTDSSTNTTTTQVFQIDLDTYTALPTTSTTVVNLTTGGTVTIVTTKNSVTSYDQEVADNEKKRTIKLIDKQFVSQIEAELKALLS